MKTWFYWNIYCQITILVDLTHMKSDNNIDISLYIRLDTMNVQSTDC